MKGPSQSMQRATLVAFVWLLAATGAAAADPNAPAATTSWKPAQQIAGDLPAWFPEVTIDSAGVKHLVWDVSKTQLPTTAQGQIVQQSDSASLTYIRDYLLYQSFAPDGS